MQAMKISNFLQIGDGSERVDELPTVEVRVCYVHYDGLRDEAVEEAPRDLAHPAPMRRQHLGTRHNTSNTYSVF